MIRDYPVSVAYGLEIVGRIQLDAGAIASLETGLICLLPALQQKEDGTYELLELSLNPIDKSITIEELIKKMEGKRK